ncbi:HAD family hydrolase [Streptacidiphilus sp. ASG 303]|uniref:HAD family hydrolase n=1 Tax=Streptomycetaceae TaxID=2062 RepID=UPI001E2B46F7|nr:haloacid dehalogenase-like hydrolase [Streptacidiphilus sp. ASG 303]MCD0485737.1 haloacid dehalogenase-like hydrolase [Streptacidiphilus sp. ASG 303]
MAAVTSGAPLTVGFDLDMTLLDTRPGIRATYDAVAAETGVRIDSALAVTRLGPPLEVELAHWFPEHRIPEVADRYRELYVDIAVPACVPLPGAAEAVAAVRAHGGRVVVVTGKHGPNAQRHLDHVGLAVDALAGSVWAQQKGEALRAEAASVYVGDHLGDITGARAAGALAVAVATGPYGAEALREAGADAVLEDLTAFPAWLDGHLAGAPSPR